MSVGLSIAHWVIELFCLGFIATVLWFWGWDTLRKRSERKARREQERRFAEDMAAADAARWQDVQDFPAYRRTA